MTEPVEFVDAAQEEWVVEVPLPDQPTSTTVRSEIITVALRLGVMMLEAGFDTRAAINAMTGCARALGMADLSVTALGRTMMASHVSERGVPITMTRAATTIDSFDLHRMGRLHQVLAEMLREDVDVKRASDLMDQLEQEPSPWPWWVVVLGGMVLAASITLQTGGSLLAAALASGCLLLVNRFGALLDRIGLPRAFSVSGQAALAVLLGVLLNVCGLATISASAAIIATGLVLLLPIPQIVQAAQDAINTLLRHRSGTADGRPGARLDDDSRWDVGAQPSRRSECHGGGVRHSPGTFGTVARDRCMHGRCSRECGVHARWSQAAASCGWGGSVDRDRQCRSSTSRFAGPDIGSRDSSFGARCGVRSVIRLPAHSEYRVVHRRNSGCAVAGA